jgi:hypothetical protein
LIIKWFSESRDGMARYRESPLIVRNYPEESLQNQERLGPASSRIMRADWNSAKAAIQPPFTLSKNSA